MGEKAVAYLDILGFSNAVKQSIDDAIMCLSSFNTILETKIRDLRTNPKSSYDPRLQDLIERTSIDSFDEFIPFSDSVFVTSHNCSSFVLQLGDFALNSFRFTSHIYRNPENPDDPTLTYTMGLQLNSNGDPEVVDKPCHQPPVLFRGGISFGEVVNMSPLGIVGGNVKKIDTLAGKAVVNAVRYEHCGVSGPRLVLDDSLYSQLDERAKRYCRPLPELDKDGLFEIMWPSMIYIIANPYNIEFQNYYELFDAAYNLWVPFRKDGNNRVADHYLKFMELIIAGTIQIYDTFWDAKDFAKEKIQKHLYTKGIADLFNL